MSIETNPQSAAIEEYRAQLTRFRINDEHINVILAHINGIANLRVVVLAVPGLLFLGFNCLQIAQLANHPNAQDIITILLDSASDLLNFFSHEDIVKMATSNNGLNEIHSHLLYPTNSCARTTWLRERLVSYIMHG